MKESTKKSVILGISAFYHDSAAALVIDGKIIAAAQEERFSRVKHDERFPSNAIKYCLNEAKIEIEAIDYIVFYEKPLLKFERLLETYIAFAPRGFRSFLKAMPIWLKQKLHLPRTIKKGLEKRFDKAILFTGHHESHAASAFFPSPFDEAAILTIDGVGEWDTATIGIGEGNRIQILKRLEFPHSLGLLYSAFTYFTGFRVNSGEYKLMGLAPYGKPTYVQAIKDHLVDIKDDGSIAMDMSYFNYCQGETMTNDKFSSLFNGPPRQPEQTITQRELDLAASIQAVTEEIVIKMAWTAKKVTGKSKLCLAGGVALNCVANGKLLKERIFDDIWIQPASGDAGGALGAALFVDRQLLGRDEQRAKPDAMQGSRLGPSFTSDAISEAIAAFELDYTQIDDDAEYFDKIASALARNKVVGWFQGRMEYGPRALGSRSILGNPMSEEMQSKLNLKIKYRESFRPFAPSVLVEDCDKYFQIDSESPYMLVVSETHPRIRKALTDTDEQSLRSTNLIDRVNVPKSEIPAVTHVDQSARIQTIDKQRDGSYYRLIEAFKAKTGCSVLVNTSFNIRGEPIVATPEDAIRCFLATEMDILAIGRFILSKERQSNVDLATFAEEYKAQFALD